VHVVLDVRREPHIIRGRRGRSEVREQGRVGSRGGPGGHDSGAPRRIVPDVAIVHERIVPDRIVPGIGGVAVARHVFHVRFPRKTIRLEAVHDVRGLPRLVRAGIGLRIPVVALATEVRRARETKIVRQAWVDRAIQILGRQAVRTRESRQVGSCTPAACQNVAEVVILHDDDEDIVEVGSRRGGSPEDGRDRCHPRRVGRRREQHEREEQGDEDRPHHRVHSSPSFPRPRVPPVAAHPVKTLGEIVPGSLENGNEVTEFRHARSPSDSCFRSGDHGDFSFR